MLAPLVGGKVAAVARGDCAIGPRRRQQWEWLQRVDQDLSLPGMGRLR